MVKIKAPLLSLGARGLVGPLSYLTRRKTKIAEKTPVVPDAKSLAQLSWRHMYQKCAALWHTLSAAEKQEWESLARPKHMTGFAYWQSQCLKPNPGIYLPLQGGTMAGNIDMAKNRLLRLPAPVDAQEAFRLSEYATYVLPYLLREGARVYHDVEQDIPNNTNTFLAFNSERYDTDSIHDSVTNNSRLTCKTAGKYVISGHARFQEKNVGLRLIAIYLNGATPIANYRGTHTDAIVTARSIATIYDLAVNDYIELRVWQNSGIVLAINSSGNLSPEFAMQRIG